MEIAVDTADIVAQTRRGRLNIEEARLSIPGTRPSDSKPVIIHAAGAIKAIQETPATNQPNISPGSRRRCRAILTHSTKAKITSSERQKNNPQTSTSNPEARKQARQYRRSPSCPANLICRLTHLHELPDSQRHEPQKGLGQSTTHEFEQSKRVHHPQSAGGPAPIRVLQTVLARGIKLRGRSRLKGTRCKWAGSAESRMPIGRAAPQSHR